MDKKHVIYGVVSYRVESDNVSVPMVKEIIEINSDDIPTVKYMIERDCVGKYLDIKVN